jgi:hypothetical protein
MLCAASVAAALACPTAGAQSLANDQVSITLDAHTYAGNQIPSSTYVCTGTPTCSVTTSFATDCPGGGTFSSTVTGLNLAQSGPIQGTISQTGNGTTLVEGTCQSATAQFRYEYSGSWNAATQTGTFSVNTWTYTITGAGTTVNACTIVPNACPPFSGSLRLEGAPAPVAPAPVFPLTVTSNITPTSATAAAVIQYRPQDVGKAGDVYVFAVAPSSIVKAAAGTKSVVVGWAKDESKADPVSCVLAQLNSSGQLQAVTPAQLQSAISGVFASTGASVPIMNNVSTPNVASATFYVGYGSSSTSMLNEGVFRNAITVPGASVCPMVSSQTALWWNPAESGWGLNLNHQGNTLFGTLFTYDASGVPLWLVMDNGKMQSDGLTFTGPLYRTTGPAFNAAPFNPSAVGASAVGSMTVSFQDVNSGTLRYTVNGVEVAKAIQRQVYGSRAAACFPTTASRTAVTNYQDLWWNPAESGWGVNVTHQDNTLFATLFTYDASGRDLWLVMDNGTRTSGTTYSGPLYRTSGPPFNSTPFNPSAVGATPVGTMSFSFTDGNNGTLTYTYNGAPVTKQITRQLFSSPVPLCN